LGFDEFGQVDVACLSLILNQSEKQNLELRLNRRRLVYTKSGIFGLSYLSELQAKPKVVKILSVLVSRGSQSKSNIYVIEHPLVVVGQWSPSSSEDG
jgi:hypothetical protein